MTTKKKTTTPAPDPKPNEYPFLVINSNCNNVEGSFRTLKDAMENADSDHDSDELDNYIYIVEVKAVYRIETKPRPVPATLSDLEVF